MLQYSSRLLKLLIYLYDTTPFHLDYSRNFHIVTFQYTTKFNIALIWLHVFEFLFNLFIMFFMDAIKLIFTQTD